MKKRLIISRYDENIEWLNNFKEYKITIYNKGNESDLKGFNNVINLKNVGRESHTFIYHIINNYDSLDDINIFLQGKIEDLGCMAYNNLHDYEKDIDKYGFSVSRYGILGPFHWSHNVGVDRDPRYKNKWENEEISKSNLGFRKFAKNLFPEIPYFVATSYSGCFAVKKENIRNLNLSIYKNILDYLSINKNPIEGHYMERLWCYMFTKNKVLRLAFKDVIKTKIERFKLFD